MAAAKLNDLAPVTEDDEAIRRALKEAHIPSLMAALVHITGDLSIIRGDIRPTNAFFGDAQGGITEAQQEKIRGIALQALKKYRDQGHKLPPAPSADIVEMVNFVIGTEVHGDYAEFLTAELAMDDNDPYGVPELAAVPAAQRAKFKVVIVGSGMSGLLAGIRLQEAGIPFEIIERHANVGGTWYQNTYPGCRVDSPNHTYSYSFRPNDWPQFYSQQEVLRQYFDKTADDYGLRKHIRFNTEVKSCAYDDKNGAVERRRAEKGRQTGNARRERGDQRGRAVEPAEVAGHSGTGSLQRHRVPFHRSGNTNTISPANACS